MSSNSSAPQGLPEANPKTLFGPIFIGNIINWFLLGTLAVQLYIYLNSKQSRGDTIWIRLLVFCVVVVDLAQSVVVTQETWHSLIDIWGREDLLNTNIPWSGALLSLFDGIIAWMVQSFYAWRIWTLTTGGWVRTVPVFIEVLSIMQFAASLAGTVGILDENGSTRSIERIQGSIDAWLAGSLVNDVIIAACMIGLLYKARSRTVWVQSQSLYDRLIINTVQTGLITALVAGADLFLWVHYPAEYYDLAAAIVLGKFYSNAFISTLNGRVFRDNKNDSPRSMPSSNSSGSTGVEVQIHIAQQRERRIDESAGNPRSGVHDISQNATWKPRPSSVEDTDIYELSTLSKGSPVASHKNDNANMA